MSNLPEFKEWPKISRLNRTVVVTEKIDGTNACVIVTENGQVFAQSRTRVITPENDNFGFAKWVKENEKQLVNLGVGYHFGEWWGQGIQRGYGLKEKRFSLFNTAKWSENRPNCCHVVPVIETGLPEEGFNIVLRAVMTLRVAGSIVSPGFMSPEGVVAFHTHSNSMFKVTLEKDQEHKGSNR